MEEIQDQIAICAKTEIKVKKRNKGLKKKWKPKKEIKVQKRNKSPNRKGNKSPNTKGKKPSKYKLEKVNCLKKKIIPKITM